MQRQVAEDSVPTGRGEAGRGRRPARRVTDARDQQAASPRRSRTGWSTASPRRPALADLDRASPLRSARSRRRRRAGPPGRRGQPPPAVRWWRWRRWWGRRRWWRLAQPVAGQRVLPRRWLHHRGQLAGGLAAVDDERRVGRRHQPLRRRLPRPAGQIGPVASIRGSPYYDIYEKSASACSPAHGSRGTSMHERGLAVDFTCNGGGVIGVPRQRLLPVAGRATRPATASTTCPASRGTGRRTATDQRARAAGLPSSPPPGWPPRSTPRTSASGPTAQGEALGVITDGLLQRRARIVGGADDGLGHDRGVGAPAATLPAHEVLPPRGIRFVGGPGDAVVGRVVVGRDLGGEEARRHAHHGPRTGPPRWPAPRSACRGRA